MSGNNIENELAYWKQYANVCQHAILSLEKLGPNLNLAMLRPTGIPKRSDYNLGDVDPNATIKPLWY